MIRTHDAGTLRSADVGATVTLAGWVARRRDHGGVAFLDLRDASGVVQVVVRDATVAHGLRAEYCVRVTGQVGLRPPGNANAELPTGEVEVVSTSLTVLSESAPFGALSATNFSVRRTNGSRPTSKRVLPSTASIFSITFCVAMPAWSVPGTQSASVPRMRAQRTSTS